MGMRQEQQEKGGWRTQMQGLAMGKKRTHLLEGLEIKNEDGPMAIQWRKTVFC